MINKVIVALDNIGQDDAMNFIKSNPQLTFYKIGLEFFLSHGKDFVKKLRNDFGKDIFLDLKLHDIPNTVEKAIKSLKDLDIQMLTLHASGGKEMLYAAANAKNEYLPDCKLLGVTILTSLDQKNLNEMFGINEMPIPNLVRVCEESKVDGIVCSAIDLRTINTSLIKVCPGIRFKDEIGKAQQDQKRVMDPETAFLNGANYLVMGRSLTQNKNLANSINFLERI